MVSSPSPEVPLSIPVGSSPQTGIDELLLDKRLLSSLKRVGCLTNKASLTAQGNPTAYALGAILKDDLECLFSPEHGWSTQGEDGKDVPDEIESYLKKPIYSLYGTLLEKNLSHLNSLETLIIDIQDVGVRCYTFAATCAKVLEYVSTLEKPPKVIICDRPNPLGKAIKGSSFNPDLQSLVQYLNVPFQHGQSIGRLLLSHNLSLPCPLPLRLIPYQNEFQPFHHRWVPPSPALPDWTSVILYPGLVLLEGLNISLGRGTDKPFKSIGSPSLKPEKLLPELERTEGLLAMPITFMPKSSIFQNQICQGVGFQITNFESLDAYGFGCRLMEILYKTDPDFQWIKNNEKGTYWIDTLLGSNQFRLSL